MACGKPNCGDKKAVTVRDPKTQIVQKQLEKLTTKTMLNGKIYIVKPK